MIQPQYFDFDRSFAAVEGQCNSSLPGRPAKRPHGLVAAIYSPRFPMAENGRSIFDTAEGRRLLEIKSGVAWRRWGP
ncbi:MAG: hypothetical protein KGI75_30070, partial [Rhizobiaceae bacterium]|nr:hypothetical protein [Rhizobiaceae bacterium]